jgi:hypothetical protein
MDDPAAVTGMDQEQEQETAGPLESAREDLSSWPGQPGNQPDQVGPLGAGLPGEIEFGPGEISWLRLALNDLESNMGVELNIPGVDKSLQKLRIMLRELELERFRRHGPAGYLLITPLGPDSTPDFAARVTSHIETLDNLGQIVRLG